MKDTTGDGKMLRIKNFFFACNNRAFRFVLGAETENTVRYKMKG